MKHFIVSVLALVSATSAFANQDLQIALGALGQAKMYLSQGQTNRATDAILNAESSIYRAMNDHSGPNPRTWLCSFNYRGDNFQGRGPSENEARNMLINDCIRRKPELTSICDDFANNPYTTTCVERSF